MTSIGQAKPTIVCVGDSITYGDTGLGHRAEHPWPQQLEPLLSAHVINCGHNGAASTDWPDMDEYKVALDAMPETDILIVGLGVNDVYHGVITSPNQTVEALKRIEDITGKLIRTAGHEIAVCLLSVPQLSEEEPVMCRLGIEGILHMNPLLAALNECYRTACPKLGWHYVDYTSEINGHRELHGDSIHPNQAGYDAIAHSIATQLMTIHRGTFPGNHRG